MTESAGRSRLLAKNPAGFSSLASGIQSDRLRRRCRRRIRCPLFVSSDWRNDRGKRSIPVTPLLQWKFDGEGSCSREPKPDPGDKTIMKHKRPACGHQPAASARRLAAGICHLRLPKSVGGGETSLDLEANCGQPHLPYVSGGNCLNLHPYTNGDFISLLAIKNRSNGLSQKLLEEQKTNKFFIVSALRSELELARSKISELEAERLSAEKRIDHFMRKNEEKAALRRREHEKIRSVIDAMKGDLNRERKNAQRLESMNTKLFKELSAAKLSSKQFLHEYEKERKARELVEEVCNELAKEIGDDKAEVEALKMESVKIREEVEEERNMLQMAEVWREERVQMKLIDAKLALEDKYSKLSKLQGEIEAFLSLRSGSNHDACETKQAKFLKEAVGSIIDHDTKEFSYQPPPASDGIFSISEELQLREHGNVKEIEQCHGSVTLEANGFVENTMKRHDNMLLCDGEEDDSGWETASHVEEQDSCKSHDESEPSVIGVYVESQASVSRADCDKLKEDEKQSSEISEVCSVTIRQSRKKGSSLSRLWKSSRAASNADDFKKFSLELTNRGLCNGRSFNAALSPARKSAETGLSSTCVGHWSSPDFLNPHITKGMKSHVDWPQPTKKQSLKAKLMEARIQNQKVQLRQVLEQKI